METINNVYPPFEHRVFSSFHTAISWDDCTALNTVWEMLNLVLPETPYDIGIL